MSSHEQPTPAGLEEFIPLAADFVQACQTAGINLDFHPRTLPLVDRVLQGARGEVQELTAKQDPQAPELKKKNAM